MSELKLENISVAAEAKTVVSDVSLSVASGELHVLMGPNGSGKSSLLSGVMGHPKFALNGGKILIDGEEITGLSTEEKARKGIFLSMQYIPEIPGVTLLNFLHRAYRANAEYPHPNPLPEKGEGAKLSILDYYKLLEGKAKEVGIDPSYLKRQVGSGLSGGEKKQAEMLQLLALKPKFALLDEIDSGVDVDAMKHIVAGIAKARTEGTGVLWVTHYASLLKQVTPDHVSVMQEGKIVRTGGHELAAEIAEKGFEAKIQ